MRLCGHLHRPRPHGAVPGGLRGSGCTGPSRGVLQSLRPAVLRLVCEQSQGEVCEAALVRASRVQVRRQRTAATEGGGGGDVEEGRVSKLGRSVLLLCECVSYMRLIDCRFIIR